MKETKHTDVCKDKHKGNKNFSTIVTPKDKKEKAPEKKHPNKK